MLNVAGRFPFISFHCFWQVVFEANSLLKFLNSHEPNAFGAASFEKSSHTIVHDLKKQSCTNNNKIQAQYLPFQWKVSNIEFFYSIANSTFLSNFKVTCSIKKITR